MGSEVGNCTLYVDRMISIHSVFFNQLRQSDQLIDLHIVTKENRMIPVHRSFLCAQFPKFVRHLLQNQGPTMKWPRFSTGLVQAVIDFAYTGKSDINVSNVCQLYLFARNLGSKPLMDGCWKFIEERFERINVNAVWMISSILGKHDLRNRCVLKIARDFDSFAEDHKCLRCTTVKDMEALLSSPWLWAPSEDTKLKGVVSWINAAPSSCERDTRDGFFTRLLSTLIANKLSPFIMNDIETGESDIILSDGSRHALLDYWRTWDELEEKRKWERIFIYGHYTKIGIPFLSAAPNVKGIERMFTLPYRKDSCTVTCDEYVYVIGGSAGGVSSASVSMVNPCNGEVKETKPMSQSRKCASAVTVEHEILVFGGSVGPKYLNICEKYSPSEYEWVALPNMPTGRCGTGAVHVPNFGVLVLGGKDEIRYSIVPLKTVEFFQISSSNPVWCPVTPMLEGRFSPAVEFFKGCVYVAGSLESSTHSAEVLSLFDGLSRQWTLIPHCESIGARPVSMLAVGNHLYVGTSVKNVYELETQHDEKGMNRKGYSWRYRFQKQNGYDLRLLKVLINA
nr:kelch protein 4 [Hymenolepis microstoma]